MTTGGKTVKASWREVLFLSPSLFISVVEDAALHKPYGTKYQDMDGDSPLSPM